MHFFQTFLDAKYHFMVVWQWNVSHICSCCYAMNLFQLKVLLYFHGLYWCHNKRRKKHWSVTGYKKFTQPSKYPFVFISVLHATWNVNSFWSKRCPLTDNICTKMLLTELARDSIIRMQTMIGCLQSSFDCQLCAEIIG